MGHEDRIPRLSEEGRKRVLAAVRTLRSRQYIQQLQGKTMRERLVIMETTLGGVWHCLVNQGEASLTIRATDLAKLERMLRKLLAEFDSDLRCTGRYRWVTRKHVQNLAEHLALNIPEIDRRAFLRTIRTFPPLGFLGRNRV